MGNRFGRNQKRRMREAAEQLKANHAGEIREARDALFREGLHARQLEEEIREAKRIAGRMSVIFEASTLDVEGPRRRGLYAAGRGVPDSVCAARTAVAPQIPLDVMVANAGEDALSGAIHVRVNFGDGSWGYALSRDAIRYSPGDVLVGRIAHELARIIAPALRNFRA